MNNISRNNALEVGETRVRIRSTEKKCDRQKNVGLRESINFNFSQFLNKYISVNFKEIRNRREFWIL